MKEILCSQTGKLNIVRIAILLKTDLQIQYNLSWYVHARECYLVRKVKF